LIDPKKALVFIGLACFLTLAVGVLETCQKVPPQIYDNPLDTLDTGGDNPSIETPALVFFPAQSTVNLGFSVTLSVYALEVYDLAGGHILVQYDKNRLSLLSITEGDFFANGLETIFIYEDNSATGILDIYSSFLGSDTVSVNGTGSLADLVFTTLSSGQSILTYSDASTLVDPDNNPISIVGYGQGVIDAQ